MIPCIVSKIPDGLQNAYKIIGGLYIMAITYVETLVIVSPNSLNPAAATEGVQLRLLSL